MAIKAVDAAQLDEDLTSVADAIREKGGTAEALSFPDEFVSAIEAISPAPEEVDMYAGQEEPEDAVSGDLWMDTSDEAAEIEPLSVTANGTYTAPTRTGYSPVTVNVPEVVKNVQAYTTPVSATSTTMADTNMKLTVSKTGTYTIYVCCGCNRNSGSYYYRLRKDSTDLVASTAISTTNGVCKVLTNQYLTQGTVLTVGLQSASTSYRAYATLLMIIEN